MKSVSVEVEPDRGTTIIIVEFSNVVGKLRSGGRPHGFSIVGGSEGSKNVYDIKLDNNCVIVRSLLAVGQIIDLSLHYGFGTNPYCNIMDEGGRSLPVFGPIPLGKLRVDTSFAFVSTLRVSDFQPSAGKLEKLDYPKDVKALNLKTRNFCGFFCDMHTYTAAHGIGDFVIYYACENQLAIYQR